MERGRGGDVVESLRGIEEVENEEARRALAAIHEALRRLAEISYPLYMVASTPRIVVTEEMDTMGVAKVGGRSYILVSPSFVENLRRSYGEESTEVLAGILVHEALHLIYNHPQMLSEFVELRRSEVPERIAALAINIAADALVNDAIRKAGLRLPDNVVLPETVEERIGVEVDPEKDTVIPLGEKILRKLWKELRKRCRLITIAVPLPSIPTPSMRGETRSRGAGLPETGWGARSWGSPSPAEESDRSRGEGAADRLGGGARRRATSKEGGERGGGSSEDLERAAEEVAGEVEESLYGGRKEREFYSEEEARRMIGRGLVLDPTAEEVRRGRDELEELRRGKGSEKRSGSRGSGDESGAESENHVDRLLQMVAAARARSWREKGYSPTGRGALGLAVALGKLKPVVPPYARKLYSFVDGVARGRPYTSFDEVDEEMYAATGRYAPGMVRERLVEVVIGIDVSGSITPREIKEFLSHVAGIALRNRREVTIYFWDTAVEAKFRVRTLGELERIKSMIEAGELPMGGGTDPSAFLEAVLKDYGGGTGLKNRFVVVLTDGEFDATDRLLRLAREVRTRCASSRPPVIAVTMRQHPELERVGWKQFYIPILIEA